MISIYAFSLFLWICLAVQVPTQGAVRKITKAKRVDLGEKFKLIVEFESDSPVQALWRKYEYGQYVNLTGSKLENGKTTLKVAKKEMTGGYVYVILGDMPSHLVFLEWNLEGDGNRKSTGECPLADITSEVDLPNAPGQKLEVKVEDKGRGLDHLNFSEASWTLHGEFWNGANNSVVYTYPMEESSESQNGTTTSTFTFQAGPDEPLVGYVYGVLSVRADDREKSPVWQLGEVFSLELHKEGEEIPFPNELMN